MVKVHASTVPPAKVTNKEDLDVSVHLDGKDLFVTKTLMTVLKAPVYLVLIVLIWLMTSPATVPMDLVASDVKLRLTFVAEPNVSMELVLISFLDTSEYYRLT